MQTGFITISTSYKTNLVPNLLLPDLSSIPSAVLITVMRLIKLHSATSSNYGTAALFIKIYR